MKRMLETLTVGAILSFSAALQAQLAPHGQPPLGNPDGPNATVRSPFWGGGELPPVRAAMDSPFRQLEAVPPARANAVAARWAFRQAQNDYERTIREMHIRQLRDPQYQAALLEQQTALRELRQRRQEVLEPLRSSATYRAASDLQEMIRQQLREEHARPAELQNPARIEALARTVVDYGRSNLILETDALRNDAPYQQSLKRAREANAKLAVFRQELEDTIRFDPDMVAMRRQIADLRIARLASNAYYDATLQVANASLDYAYWFRYQERFIPRGYASGFVFDPYGWQRSYVGVPSSHRP